MRVNTRTPLPAHTPPHTPLLHSQVCGHLQSKASLAQFLIIIYEACRQGETRKDTQTDSGRCCSALGACCTGSAPQARRSFYLPPHTPSLKSIGLHLPRFRFLISLLTPSSEAIALMERVLPQTQFCHCHAPLPPPLFFSQVVTGKFQLVTCKFLARLN